MISKRGHIVILGLPNVGKSTLLNSIIGEKLSIVTPKPQTTRDSILGIKRYGDAELLFLDTPGFERTKGALHMHMKNQWHSALDRAEIALVMVTPPKLGAEDRMVLEAMKHREIPTIVLINKIDRTRDKGGLLPLISEIDSLGFSPIIPISALKGDGIDIVLDEIVKRLPTVAEGEGEFSKEDYTDKSVRFLVTELIREQLILNLHEELPYGIAVTMDVFEKEEERHYIAVTIHVEKANHKPIVIGHGGALLKKVGTAARLEIKKILQTPVFLELFVRVTDRWTKNENKVSELLRQ